MCILVNLIDSSLSDGEAEREEQMMFGKFLQAFDISEERFKPFFEVIVLKNDRSVFTNQNHPKNQLHKIELAKEELCQKSIKLLLAQLFMRKLVSQLHQQTLNFLIFHKEVMVFLGNLCKCNVVIEKFCKELYERL